MAESSDINDLVDGFINLSSMIDDVMKQSEQVQNQMHTSDKCLYDYSCKDKQDKKEIESLQEMITNYQSMLSGYNVLKEEKLALEDRISELVNQKEKIEQDLKEAKEDWMKEIDSVKIDQNKRIQSIEDDYTLMNAEMKELHESEIQRYTKDLNDVTQTLEEQRKQHKFAVNRMHVEFEGKMDRLKQRYAQQTSQASNSLTARNDIFRKKLEHLQKEYDKDTSCLNRRCNEYEHAISELRHQVKLQNKQLQESGRSEQDKLRHLDKVNRQSQSEIRKLQNALKQEHDRSDSLERKLQEFHDDYQQRHSNNDVVTKATESVPKKRKAMFNPQKNRLNAL